MPFISLIIGLILFPHKHLNISFYIIFGVMSKKNIQSIVGVILLIVVIGIFFVFSSYLKSIKGVKLSCEEGKIIGFGSESMPLMTAVPSPECYGYVKVSSSNKIICENFRTTRQFPESVMVPCPNLKENKDVPLTIEFITSSPIYGNFSGREVLTYR